MSKVTNSKWFSETAVTNVMLKILVDCLGKTFFIAGESPFSECPHLQKLINWMIGHDENEDFVMTLSNGVSIQTLMESIIRHGNGIPKNVILMFIKTMPESDCFTPESIIELKALDKDYEQAFNDVHENRVKPYLHEYTMLLSTVNDEYKKCEKEQDYRNFIGKYGYTVPTKEMIDKMVEFIDGKSVLEIGAGYGLVSYLLKLRGINVVATDSYSENINVLQRNQIRSISDLMRKHSFTTNKHVQEFLPHSEAFKKYSECEILLMIWPNYADLNIDEFQGKHVIFIGTAFNTPCNYKHFITRVRESNFQQQIDQSVHYPIKSPFFKYHAKSYVDQLFFYDKL